MSRESSNDLGDSLHPEDSEDLPISSAADEQAVALRRRRRIGALLAVALVVFVIDQLTKNWALATLTEHEVVPVFGEALQWYLVRNPGAAFSMASGMTWVFTLLSTIVVGVIVWQVRQLGSRLWALFFALLLGGVLGNLADRLLREPGFPVGHVIDFISTPWMLPAIYNVADIAIVSSMGIFVLLILFGVPIDGSPRVRRTREHANEAGANEADTNTADTMGEAKEGE